MSDLFEVIRGCDMSKAPDIAPASVLDARSGVWQERKRAWLALGIESELGRQENLQGLSAANEEYRYNKSAYLARIGRGPLASKRVAL